MFLFHLVPFSSALENLCCLFPLCISLGSQLDLLDGFSSLESVSLYLIRFPRWFVFRLWPSVLSVQSTPLFRVPLCQVIPICIPAVWSLMMVFYSRSSPSAACRLLDCRATDESWPGSSGACIFGYLVCALLPVQSCCLQSRAFFGGTYAVLLFCGTCICRAFHMVLFLSEETKVHFFWG